MSTEWKVLPHGPIEKLDPNLWRVEGELPHFSMKRVMTVARLANGDLVIHSAIALEEPSMRELEAWGRPAWLVVPHRRHRMDAPRWKARYPQLRVLVPRGRVVNDKAREVVTVDATTDTFPDDDRVRFETLDGTGEEEIAMIVRAGDGAETVVLTEVVFDLKRPRSLAARVLTRAMGLRPGAKVTLVVKLELVKDRAALRSHLLRLASLDGLVRLIVSHDRMSSGPDARGALRAAASTL